MDFISNAASGVAGEVATSSFAEIKKHVGYIYHYKDNQKALEKAKAPLEAKRTDGSRFSDDTKRRLKVDGAVVTQWQSDADELHLKSEKLISRNNISCLNLWSRYSTSKHAWDLTQNINKMVERAPDFGTSFDRTIAEGAKFKLRGYMEFKSRRRTQDEVLEALKRDDVTMCSICGMGGIGKTTLAKNLVKEVEADGCFEKAAMIIVSQNPKFEEIQTGIIDSLGLKFEENTMSGRAKKLHDWLSNHMTLLILDDVWWQIEYDDFEEVGIPVASNRCKIVVTSRNIDECKKMGCELNFPLNVLDDGEAQELFIQNAGKCVQDQATQIVDECGGLPIAIVTIARALKDKPQGAWDDSLKKLQKSNLPGISDMDKVHSKIQVSYDLLKDLEAQTCLRLCCLFPEDYDVPVEKLVFYGWGLEIFEGVDRLKEARDRVDSIVYKLKSSFLLLDSEKKGCVKLHDMVRDFAIWISSKDEHPYFVRRESEMKRWPKNLQYEKISAISLFVHKEIMNHPIGFRCPNLKLLQLHSKYGSDELPNDFFYGMEELRVVDVHVPSKLPPLTVQKALRTLLIRNDSHQMVHLGEGYMKNLEILSLYCMSLSIFPVEIGMMCNLRCLRLFRASFTYMTPGVLSKLVQLEELELPLTFSDWGIQKEGRTNANLNEIEFLPLTSITIGLQKGSILAKSVVKSITSFRIHIGSPEYDYYDIDTNVLVVRKVDACDSLVKWTNSLLRKCHRLELERVDLKYIMSQQLGGNNCYQTECFSQLTNLDIQRMNCLEEILNGTYLSNIQQSCFTNLTKIVIKNCPKLKRAFPLSVTREFTQLQSMTLSNCGEMEAVFYDDRVESEFQVERSVNAPSKGNQLKHIPTNQNVEERIEKASEREVDHAVVLPQLVRLHLHDMPELRVVDYRNHAIKCPSLKELEIKMCNDMECLSYKNGRLKLHHMKGHLKNIFKWLPLAQENGILQIKRLKITRCREMKNLADAIEGPTLFSNLKELWIESMDNLEEIWHGPYLSMIHSQCFSNLIELNISHCPKMKHLFPLPVATELRQLKLILIESCEEIEDIFYKDQEDHRNQVALRVCINNLTTETATTTTLVNPNKVEKSSICCPTPISFIQCLQRKGKQPEHLPSHQSTEENIQKVDLAIAFPQLKVLSLSCMPKLRVMYSGNHAIECPSLEELTITDCNKMEGLSYGSFNAPKIKKLVLERARHLKNIAKLLYFGQDCEIPWLERLRISSCPEMIYVVNAMIYVEELYIERMGDLEEIWHGPYLSITQPQPCFTHLTYIAIRGCPKLKHVFPLSVATELTQLVNLMIESCEGMEEIFYKDQVADGNQKASAVESNSPVTGTEITLPYSSIPMHQSREEDIQKVAPAIVLPQLKKLSLIHMPELRVMYNGNHTIECPSLEELSINDCKNMEDFSYGSSFSAPKIKNLKLQWMKTIPKWLHLEQDSGILSKELWIGSCNEMIYLVDAMKNRNLQKTMFCNCEDLCIWNMAGLEEICHGPYLSQPCFTYLTKITIKFCPKLKHVFPLSVATELTQLQFLAIRWCKGMEKILYKDQVADGNQKASNVESNSPTTGIELTLPYSSIPTHQKTVKKTTTKKDADDATVDATIFPRLEFLALEELPKLRVFYDGNHAIEFPSLDILIIRECDNIVALSNGSFKAPKLQEITINWEDYPCRGDLNTIVKKTLNIVKEEEKDKDGEENEDTTSNTAN